MRRILIGLIVLLGASPAWAPDYTVTINNREQELIQQQVDRRVQRDGGVTTVQEWIQRVVNQELRPLKEADRQTDVETACAALKALDPAALAAALAPFGGKNPCP